MEKMTIGKFIAALRRAHGMTQKELAQKLDNKRATDAAAVLAKDASVMEKL